MAAPILVDVLRWGEGGTRTYARTTIRELYLRYPDVWVLCDQPTDNTLFGGLGHGDRRIVVDIDASRPLQRYYCQRFRLPAILRRHGFGTYFVPGESTGLPVPFEGVRVVRMLRNMLPLDEVERRRFGLLSHPYTRLRLRLLRGAALRGLPRSDRVIGVSHYALAQLGNYVNIRDATVVHHSVESALPKHVGDAPPSTPTPYMLYVSVTHPYKRQLEIIDGYEMAKDKDPELPTLVLSGPVVGAYGKRVVAKVRACRHPVLLLGEGSPAEVRHLMEHASVLLFGSTCECCPNILLEYLASTRPILCSSVGPMPEIGGDAVLYADVKDTAAWSEQLRRITRDRALQLGLIERATQRVRRFTVDVNVEATYAALRD